MGSSILRFYRPDNEERLIVKYAPAENADATADIEANIYGYEQLKRIGAAAIVPPALRELRFSCGVALVMQDLGKSVGASNAGILSWRVVAESVTSLTAATCVESGDDYVEEVLSHIHKFSPGFPSKKVRCTGRPYAHRALMLLDFTPDNVFVQSGIRFIDPWRQSSYYGHPAVSLGQFAALLRMYDLRDALDGIAVLKATALGRLSELLGCDADVSEHAYRLGETLQLLLSAYVRRDVEPVRAGELYNEALALWD